MDTSTSTAPRKLRKFVSDEAIVAAAIAIIEGKMRNGAPVMDSPSEVRDYMRLQLAGREREFFACLWLDTQHRVIAFEELFSGTLSQTSVYPREVVKSALRHNAAAVIFAHNHPSGMAEPSRSDELLTRALKDALALVDVRALDHIVAACGATVSFAERGLI
jgi:DNA repair protein RadC